MQLDELIQKVREAAADPDAPWYGSDLVPLMSDLCNEADAHRQRAKYYHKRCIDLEILKTDLILRLVDAGVLASIYSVTEIESETNAVTEGGSE